MTTAIAAAPPPPSGNRYILEARQQGYFLMGSTGIRRVDDKLRNDWVDDCVANQRPIVFIGKAKYANLWVVSWLPPSFAMQAESDDECDRRILAAGAEGYRWRASPSFGLTATRENVTVQGLLKADAIALAERIVEIAHVPRDPPPSDTTLLAFPDAA